MEIVKELEKLRDDRLLSDLARRVGVSSTRFTEIIMGRRKITDYYLTMLVEGGVIKLEHILKGRKMEDLPEPEQDRMFKLFQQDNELTRLLRIAHQKGTDLKGLLRTITGH